MESGGIRLRSPGLEARPEARSWLAKGACELRQVVLQQVPKRNLQQGQQGAQGFPAPASRSHPIHLGGGEREVGHRGSQHYLEEGLGLSKVT